MNTPMRRFFTFLLTAAFFALTVFSVRADLTRTQTISLHKGWNAVYLQVTPTDAVPADVFGSLPVAIVATYFGSLTSAEYIQNPSTNAWKQAGWGTWYAANRPDAFLSTLNAITGPRAYLILATRDFTWTVTGTVTFQPYLWQSDSYNLAGFCLDDQAPPTFDKFFSGSTAHRPCKIFRLVSDQWQLVADPVNTPMKSGEACWIYCKGGSDYQGPLKVTLRVGQQITFGDGDQATIIFANTGTDPVKISVSTVSTDAGLPLGYLMNSVTPGQINQAVFDLPQNYQMPSTLESGSSLALWLKLKRDQMTSATQSTLLKISTDSGEQVWIPATGTRPDLATP